MTLTKPTIAIFGATGGTGLSILKLCLSTGHTVRVLARTPSKLSSLSTQYPNLQIIQGDIHDVDSIKETLLHPSSTADKQEVVDVIISAIGMVLPGKGLGFTSPDTHICESGTRNILTALSSLFPLPTNSIAPSSNPLLILLSTTGISSKSRDIPLAMIPLYHWVLSVPHADKKKMEELVMESGRRWVMVRPGFLGNGEPKGSECVRTGVEVPGEKKGEGEDHAIGYTIRREDVGMWIFQECVKGTSEKWEGKCVSLTY
jgi:nucleoside-diphosphate-sugar epimerase